jgi:uncharacterized integral membrane protein
MLSTSTNLARRYRNTIMWTVVTVTVILLLLLL